MKTIMAIIIISFAFGSFSPAQSADETDVSTFVLKTIDGAALKMGFEMLEKFDLSDTKKELEMCHLLGDVRGRLHIISLMLKSLPDVTEEEKVYGEYLYSLISPLNGFCGGIAIIETPRDWDGKLPAIEPGNKEQLLDNLEWIKDTLVNLVAELK